MRRESRRRTEWLVLGTEESGKLALDDVQEAEKLSAGWRERIGRYDSGIWIVRGRQPRMAVDALCGHGVAAGAFAGETSRAGAPLDLVGRIGKVSDPVLAADRHRQPHRIAD